MHLHQDMPHLFQPLLGFAAGQQVVLCGAGNLPVEDFQGHAHFLGFDFVDDQLRRVTYGDGVAECHLGAQVFYLVFDFCLTLVDRQQALGELQHKAGKEQFEGRGHELAGQRVRYVCAAAQAVRKVGLLASLLQFVVLYHMVDIADQEQDHDAGYYQ